MLKAFYPPHPVFGSVTAGPITGTTITASTAFRGTDLGTGSTSSLNLTTAGGTQFSIANVASVTDYFQAQGGQTGVSSATLAVASSQANANATFAAKGAANLFFQTGGGTQAQIGHTASSNRYITLTGSNGGNPTISTSAGDLSLGVGTRVVGRVKCYDATAIPAGGATNTGFMFSSAESPMFGIYFGSGAPTVSAAKGSLYLRSDGSGTGDRAYINTDGGTTWTALTTAA